VEVVSYRLRVRAPVPRYIPVAEKAGPKAAAPESKGTRTVWFDGVSATGTVLYERDGLAVGASVKGPAIVEQFDATTVIPSGWSATVDEYRNLILVREGRRNG
jgi:N-methylhydantoinase A/oxoprolinase/acetone carboxylase beta subunit